MAETLQGHWSKNFRLALYYAVLMILGVRSHAYAITHLKQSSGVGKIAHLIQCTDTKATLSGVQITLLAHTPCSFKECDFLHNQLVVRDLVST